jgi:hypothetical protein
MIFEKAGVLGLAVGSAFGLMMSIGSASAQGVIVPGQFVVADVPDQPVSVVAPLPPVRASLTPRANRVAAAPARVSPPVERVAYVEPRRRAEGNGWPFSTRPGFMWIGTVY